MASERDVVLEILVIEILVVEFLPFEIDDELAFLVFCVEGVVDGKAKIFSFVSVEERLGYAVAHLFEKFVKEKGAVLGCELFGFAHVIEGSDEQTVGAVLEVYDVLANAFFDVVDVDVYKVVHDDIVWNERKMRPFPSLGAKGRIVIYNKE